MISADGLLASLVHQLVHHVGQQRWSPVAGEGVTSVEVVWHEVLQAHEPMLVWAVVTVHLADGRQHDLQLWIGARRAEHLPDFLEGKDREAMAVVADPDGDVIAYDALVDPELARVVLRRVAPEVEVTAVRPIVVERANSSVVFDEHLILKVFRRVGAGPNPDAEIPRVLADQGFTHVLPPIAELRRDGVDMAVLRPFLVGAMTAWQIARTSLRDMLADRQAPDEAGADLAPDASRLGTVVADLHLALARAFGTEPGDGPAWAEGLTHHLHDARERGRACLPDAADAERVVAQYEELARRADVGAGIRVHGNLHLDQMLKTDQGWMLLDFEGVAERRIVSSTGRASPLRDVAGVLRSIRQAAEGALAEWDLHDDELSALARRWEDRSRQAFLDGYLGTPGIDELLPASDADRRSLLAVFELDWAVRPVRHRTLSQDVDRAVVAGLLAAPAGAGA